MLEEKDIKVLENQTQIKPTELKVAVAVERGEIAFEEPVASKIEEIKLPEGDLVATAETVIIPKVVELDNTAGQVAKSVVNEETEMEQSIAGINETNAGDEIEKLAALATQAHSALK